MQVTSNIFFCFNANAAVNSIDDIKYIDPVFTQDERKIKSYYSPSYLDAIGKLIVTFQANSEYRCTANLTDTEINRSSKILTSAEHCFIHKDENGKRNYSNKVTSITWSSKIKSGEITRKVKLLKSDERTDIAILKLDRAIPFSKIKPLILARELEDEEPQDAIDLFEGLASLAGYSSDDYKGGEGKNLTYTENLTWEQVWRARDESNRKMHQVQAVSYGGASGGALLMSVDDEASDDLYLEGNQGQRILLGITSSVVRQGTDEKTLFLSGDSYGSPETYISSYKHFLLPQYVKYFNYNR